MHAPQAAFGDEEFYPDIYDKAAVLVCRLAWNHHLLDGNKRAAWAALIMFVDLNQGTWDPDPPNVDQAEQAMLAIAAGEVDEAWTPAWLISPSKRLDRGSGLTRAVHPAQASIPLSPVTAPIPRGGSRT